MLNRIDRLLAAVGAGSLLAATACSDIARAPGSPDALPSALSSVGGGAINAAATPAASPIILDSVFLKAALQVYSTGNRDSAHALMTKRALLTAAHAAAESSGDAAASTAARLGLRSWQLDASLGILGPFIAIATTAVVDTALMEAQARITWWKARDTKVSLAVAVAASATSQLLQAKATAVALDKLDLATRAGANVVVIRSLLQPVPAGGAPRPPAPPPSGLWGTIETPRAWNYIPTPVDQSACGGTGRNHDVGPGKAYATPAGVPWLSLLPCDNVRIHWRAAPYTDVIFLSNRGAAHRYIRIVGIPGPNGERPVLDGNGATIAASTPFLNAALDGLGMIVVSPPAGYTYGYKPGYIEISNLEIRNASKANSRRNRAGQTVPWQDFASAVYIERGENIAIRNCHLHDNGIGIFQNSKYDEAGQSRYLLVEGNDIHDNGVVGSAHEHNAYTEGVGTVYQYNRFGHVAKGAYGDNIKDRSAGITIRYNYMEGGVHTIALRDPQSNASWERVQKDAWGNLLVNAAYIYGNVLIARDRPDFRILWTHVLVGFGDGPVAHGNIRGGMVYFHDNTVVAQFDATQWQYTSTVLFEMLNTGTNPVVHARNNVFHSRSLTPGGKRSPFAIFYHYGNADFAGNWMTAGWLPIEPGNHANGGPVIVGSPWSGTGIDDMMTNASNNPGFVNAAQNDYHLLAASPVVGKGTGLDAEVMKTGNAPMHEYIAANQWKLRNNPAAPALGAFEP